MSLCPLCRGAGQLPDRKVHFGDGSEKHECCPACRGSGAVEIFSTSKRAITIIKPHGVWQDTSGDGILVK